MSTKVGFIGLGNVGAKLAGSILRNGYDLTVHDINPGAAVTLLDGGAHWASSARELTESVDIVVTCLPSPAVCREVMESESGVIAGMSPGKYWAEMSTTDAAEVERLGALVNAKGAGAADCPVSGGCHRAATGNIAILVGGERAVFDALLPLLTTMGRRILHAGTIGTASTLKVMTNYLATANLVAVAEALATATKVGLDLNTTFEAIRISSGNSFVHETEGQVILNGSRDINFTMELVLKDIGLFQEIADRSGIELELSPLLIEIFRDGIARYGGGEWSPNIIRRLEDASNIKVTAPGFPPEMVDDEAEAAGYEVIVNRAGGT